jgi:signal peptidase I
VTRWIAPASCLLAAAIFAAAKVRRRYMVITVAGTSMRPAFHPGDRLLLRRGGAGRISSGVAVVLRAPGRFVLKDASPPGETAASAALLMVKRVAAAPGEPVPEPVRAAVRGVGTVPAGRFVVLADNPAATDSRRWGFVAADEIVGTVVLRFPRR